jgi:hypothetical protein
VGTAEDILLSEDVSYRYAESDIFVVPNAKKTTPLYGLRKVRGLPEKSFRPIAAEASPALVAARAPEEALCLGSANDVTLFADSADHP